MKNIFILLLITAAFSIHGQDNQPMTSSYNNNIKISPIQFGKSFFEFAFELGMKGGKSSIQIAPMVMLKRNSFEEFKGIQGELQYRTYLKKWNDNETKLGPFTNIDFFAGVYGLGLTYQRDYTAEFYPNIGGPTIREDHTRNIFAAEGGIFVGMKFIVGKRITLDLLAGGGVRYSEIDDTIENSQYYDPETQYYYYSAYDSDEVFDLGYYGVKPKLNLQLGITL